jgi:hypothetical protein
MILNMALRANKPFLPEKSLSRVHMQAKGQRRVAEGVAGSAGEINICQRPAEDLPLNQLVRVAKPQVEFTFQHSSTED